MPLYQQPSAFESGFSGTIRRIPGGDAKFFSVMAEATPAAPCSKVAGCGEEEATGFHAGARIKHPKVRNDYA